jgi:MFS family permease
LAYLKPFRRPEQYHCDQDKRFCSTLAASISPKQQRTTNNKQINLMLSQSISSNNTVMNWLPSFKWRYLPLWPWGVFKPVDRPEVYQPLTQGNSRQLSLNNSLSVESSPLSDRFPNNVPSLREIERASSTTNICASIPSTQAIASKDIPLTIELLRETVDGTVTSGRNRERKAGIIGLAINDIGVGLYQWKLFWVCGFGWLCDGIWLATIPTILPRLVLEFNIQNGQEGYALLALMVGLFFGATVWGSVSDYIGRTPAFNLTLPIAAVFAVGLYFASTWLQVFVLFGCIGSGVGGNIPVDGSPFMEFLPKTHNSLTIMMAMFWAFGAIFATGVAYGVIPMHSCVAPALPVCQSVIEGTVCCTRESNDGWRILVIAMACVTFFLCLCRCSLFHFFESPKILVIRGRQHEAVAEVRALAWYNSRITWLSEGLLNEIGGQETDAIDEKTPFGGSVRNKLTHFYQESFRSLFSDNRVGINTALVWFCWAFLGTAMPLFSAFLPGLLSTVDGQKIDVPLTVVYRTTLIASVAGIFVSIAGRFLVGSVLGRKWSMALATLLAGVGIILFTLTKTSVQQLIATCAIFFCLYATWAVLFMYTSESFSTKVSGNRLWHRYRVVKNRRHYSPTTCCQCWTGPC